MQQRDVISISKNNFWNVGLIVYQTNCSIEAEGGKEAIFAKFATSTAGKKIAMLLHVK